jgi:prolyl 4-hydroxylase
MLKVGDLNLTAFDCTLLNDNPIVIRVHEFMSAQEISDLLCQSEGKWSTSKVVAPSGARTDSVRTSDSCWFEKGCSALVASIEQRVSVITGKDTRFQEPLQLVRYYNNQHYAAHHDYFNEQEACGREEVQKRGQRSLTMVVYLLDPASGGCTDFPRLHMAVKPEAGTALLFMNTDDEGDVNPQTEHAGQAVTAGTKIAMNVWVRTKPSY